MLILLHYFGIAAADSAGPNARAIPVVAIYQTVAIVVESVVADLERRLFNTGGSIYDAVGHTFDVRRGPPVLLPLFGVEMDRMRMRLAGLVGTLLLVIGCGGGDTPDLQDLGDLSGDVVQTPAPPVCVWNSAYQENYAADTVGDMLTGAQDCYVLIDPFDDPASRDVIPQLQAAGNTVGCYISVGTCEEWREDFSEIRGSCVTQQWPEWPGEFFVNDPDRILPFMVDRINTLAGWGCDMVEFDNMDFAGESETFGLNVTEAEGDTYDITLCAAVHDAGMGCMAKNYRPGGADGFDGGTFESYFNELDWWEHDHMQSLVDAGLPVIVFHYDDRRCADVTQFYRLRYGSGVSVLCEDPDVGGYVR